MLYVDLVLKRISVTVLVVDFIVIPREERFHIVKLGKLDAEQRLYMEGIYTTSVNEATIDEAPMAYKSLKDIIDVIRESVDEIEILKPIYNFKASE